MRILVKVLLSVIIIHAGNDLNSQIVYFNKRYQLNEPGIWSASVNAIETSNGYIVSGTTGDTSNIDWYVVSFMKIDDTGNKSWIKILTDSLNEYDCGYPGSLIKTIDGNYAFAGAGINYFKSVKYNAVLWKLDTNINIIWKRDFGDIVEVIDTMYSGRQTKNTFDGGYIIGGEQLFNSNPAISKMLLIKTDSSGNKEWEKSFGNSGINGGYSVIQTTDSGFAIGGFWYIPGSPTENGDPIVIKTDSLGNQKWIKNLGGPLKDNKAMVCLGKDSSIIVGANYTDQMSGSDMISRINIIKINNQGNLLWNKKYGASKLKNYLLNIYSLEDGSIIAVGSIYQDDPEPDRNGWLLKINIDGDSLWYREYKNLSGYESRNYLYNIIQTLDSGLLGCGYVLPFPPDTGTQDAWVIKLDSIGCDTAGCDPTVGIDEEEEKGGRDEEQRINVWPNPGKDKIHIRLPMADGRFSIYYELVIYDIFGRKVEEIALPAGKEEMQLNVSDYSSGIYIIMLKDSNGRITGQKFVVSKF